MNFIFDNSSLTSWHVYRTHSDRPEHDVGRVPRGRLVLLGKEHKERFRRKVSNGPHDQNEPWILLSRAAIDMVGEHKARGHTIFDVNIEGLPARKGDVADLVDNQL